MPIVDNIDPGVVLGYMTVVAAASSLIDAIQSREGLGDTGMVLLVGYVFFVGLYFIFCPKS